MMKLLRLYSIPEIFSPITFEDGINLILGEKVQKEESQTRKDKKTNGVGKSICIEFINFCLLKSYADSRVGHIPDDVLPKDTQIALDLILAEQKITIIRTTLEPDKPTIIIDGKENKFSKKSDAIDFLNHILYRKSEEVSDYPSFRELLGPLIRDEESEFKEIVRCYDLGKRIPDPDLIKPHLYFFGIDFKLVDAIQDKFTEITNLSTVSINLERNLTDNNKIKMSDVKAEINALNDELQKINSAIDSFQSNEAYESMQKDLLDINSELERLRERQAAVRLEIKRIDSLPKLETIKDKEIEIVYNQFKAGLGDAISKSLHEVMGFKKKMDEFRTKLINEKLQSLKKSLDIATKTIRDLDEKRSVKIQTVDQKGILKDIKSSYLIYEQKNNQCNKMRTQLDEYEKTEREIDVLSHQKDELLMKLDTAKFEMKTVIDSFNKSILEIHEFVMGTQKASFDIKVFNKKHQKQIAKLDMRIDDDGSRSVDREKVFIYDLALMFNEYTSKKHPRFLIHDNIFDVDQDTLVQSLNYLATQEEKNDNFQYILTLNRDKLEAEERAKAIKLDIDKHIRASFTKREQFLKRNYQEI